MFNDNLTNRFVIATSTRSGSNMLVSILDSHPDVCCYGELFRRTPPEMKHDNRRGIFRTIEKTWPNWLDDQHRLNRPHAFLDDVVRDNACKALGFKMMFDQCPWLLKNLMASSTYRTILLFRENMLAAYSSEKIALLTGQGSIRSGEHVKSVKVKFDPEEFNIFQMYRNQKLLEFCNFSEEHGGLLLKVEYTNLKFQDTFSKICFFLDVDKVDLPVSRTQKRGSSNILSRFSNTFKVNDYLEKNNLLKWKVENF